MEKIRVFIWKTKVDVILRDSQRNMKIQPIVEPIY